MHAKVMARLLDAPIFPEKDPCHDFSCCACWRLAASAVPFTAPSIQQRQGAITDNNRHLLEPPCRHAQRDALAVMGPRTV